MRMSFSSLALLAILLLNGCGLEQPPRGIIVDEKKAQPEGGLKTDVPLVDDPATVPGTETPTTENDALPLVPPSTGALPSSPVATGSDSTTPTSNTNSNSNSNSNSGWGSLGSSTYPTSSNNLTPQQIYGNGNGNSYNYTPTYSTYQDNTNSDAAFCAKYPSYCGPIYGGSYY